MQQSINLLYPATAAVKPTPKGPNIYLFILGLIIVLICSILYGFLYYQEIGVEKQAADVSAEIKELSKPAPGEVIRKSLTVERNNLKKAVKDVSDTKFVMSKPLDEISQLVDTDVLLTSVEIQTAPRSIVINGTSPSYAAISRFQGNLEQSEFFSDSYIKVGIKEEKSGVITFSIQITPSEGVLK